MEHMDEFENGKTYMLLGKDCRGVGGSKSMEVYAPGKKDLNLASRNHPWDPHMPSFSRLLPECLRPFPSFEGWYTRIIDPVTHFSVAVIMASNYATGESQVTLLFSPSDQKSDFPLHRSGIKQGGTYAVAVVTKNAKITMPSSDFEEHDSEPLGFQWEAPDIGKIVVKPNETQLDVNIKGYVLRAQLTKKLAWNDLHSKEGPEGWVRRITLFPTHWYIYSLGSRALYTFHNLEEDIVNEGEGYSHQEKNWGQTFPAGHVWLQALSHDNSSQLVCAGAYFKVGNLSATPYIFSMGYRSPNQHVDIRSNELGMWFHNIQISAKDGKFSVVGRSFSYTIQITADASPDSFSSPILAPIGKLNWEPACRESFLATVNIELYRHSAWGWFTPKKLVERRTFNQAALEFGEDLLEDFCK
ncbi:hypothetical protein O6H91_06G003300 [Diphasiastrum complanatum]|uniref:Uncharacterized protein n=1 Tax=Diphasiastrum complanatum TaxID=34168 RepID=A0ACC2DA99_DIPCM|nr:hypothetical protein O6H91_06G003300 [Diphasiastrum complanatum]